jgi:nicotine blue oxidoreductase
MRVLGVVAAAGRSGRMGSPKALLSSRHFDPGGLDEPWVRRIARIFREGGVSDVLVSIPDSADVGADVADAVTAAVVDIALVTANPQPEFGLSGSLIAALDLVMADAVVLCPVDAPGVRAPMVRKLIDTLATGVDAAVVVHAGRRGHPVAFSARCFPALREAGARGGPRAVLAALGADVAEVAVDDDAVLWDFNSPADLVAPE